MKKILSLTITLLLAVGVVSAQQPSITNIDPVNGSPGGSVFIAGSGFGTVTGNITVWFGGVAGSVVSVSDNLIEVNIPPQAPNDNLTVLNTSSGLLDTSDEKFFISHSGSTFDVTQLSAPQDYFVGAEEMFDLCTCDLDNDGLPDMATTVTSGGTELRILKNTSVIGTPSFTEVTSADFPVLDTGFPFRNIGCADLNGDGKIDLFASRNGQEKIFIFENTNSVSGTISFTKAPLEFNLEPFTTGEPFQPRRLAAKDLTGDGKPELVITNDKEGSFNILVNESTTDIAFNSTQEVFSVDAMSNTSGLSIQDIDNDGRADLVMTRRFASDVFVLRNNGAGSNISFEPAAVFSTNGSPSVNALTADFNNDGLLDILAVHITSNVAFLYENTSTEGNISFADAISITTGQESWNASAGDVNGDGLLDIVISSRAEAAYTVAINGGGFSFTSTVEGLTRKTRNVNVNDYDGDGKADVALTSFETGDNAIQVIRNSNCHSPLILNDTPIAICSGQTLTLTAVDAPGATFNWSKDASLVKSGADNFLDITTFGNYELEVVSEGGSCTNTTSINVTDGSGTVPGNPTASNNGPSCVGGDVTLSVGTVSGATYSWSGPNGFTSTDQNPLITGVTTDNAGVYTVQLQVGDCQSATDNTTVVVNQPPVFSVSTSDPTTVCTGTNVQLVTQNTAGFSFQWLREGADIGGATANTFNATTSGSYSVRVSDNSSNCEVITNSIVVTVLSQPVASFSVSGSNCTGSDVSFTSTSTVDANATVVYDWNFNDGTANGTSANETHNFATASSYNVELTISYSTGSGCTSDMVSQMITITDAASIDIQSSSTFICSGESVDLSIPNTFSNINWSTGETTAAISVSSDGTYSVTADDSNGCSTSDSFDLGVGTVPTITVEADGVPGDATVTSGAAVQLEATGADSYTWDPTDFLDDPAIPNPVATPTSTITYTVTGVLTAGCSNTSQITLTIAAEGDINITPLKAFSPNSTIDPTWRVDGVENYPDCTMSIFDERGTVIFRKEGYSNEWDATYEGNPLPEGVYYFVFSCEQIKPVSGSILVVR